MAEKEGVYIVQEMLEEFLYADMICFLLEPG